MIGVNSIEVIERQRWQQASPGSRHFVTGDLVGSEGGAQVGILFLASRRDLGEGGKRFETLKIVHHGEILVKISKSITARSRRVRSMASCDSCRSRCCCCAWI